MMKLHRYTLTKLSSFLLLALSSMSVCATSNTFAPSVLTQSEIDTRGFHETSELAEGLWTDLNEYFVTLYENGDLEQALATAQRAYAMALTVFGNNHVNTADALLKLGVIHHSFGSSGKAEEYLLQALTLLKKNLSPDHQDIAVVMTNLGNVYFDAGNIELSKKYHEQALRIRQNAFGRLDSSTAQSLYNLAILYEHEGELDRATQNYEEAIDIWSKLFGPAHPHVVNAVTHLIGTHVQQNHLQEATALQQQAVFLKKLYFGDQHSEVAKSLINLGSLYVEQEMFSPASSAYEEALSIAENVLTPKDPQLALLLYTLANVYHMQGRSSGPQPLPSSGTLNKVSENKEGATKLFMQAAPLYERAATILKASNNQADDTLQIILTELALLYQELGNAEKASAVQARINTLAH